MSRRGRALLLAQRSLGLPPLGPPPDFLDADQVHTWHEIVAAAPNVFRVTDRRFVAMLAVELVRWREGDRELSVRDMYRALGQCFVPMRARRRLLFPERVRTEKAPRENETKR